MNIAYYKPVQTVSGSTLKECLKFLNINNKIDKLYLSNREIIYGCDKNIKIYNVSALIGEPTTTDANIFKAVVSSLKATEFYQFKAVEDCIEVIDKDGTKVGVMPLYEGYGYDFNDILKDCRYIGSKYNLSKVSKFLSNDKERVTMTGVYIGADIVGTDAQKLVVISNVSNLEFLGVREFIINGDEIKSFKDAKIYLSNDCRHSIITEGDKMLIAQNIDAVYPKYNDVIPKEYEHTAIFDRLILIDEIKKALPFANQTIKQIRFSFNNDSLNLFAINKDFGTEYEKSIYVNSDIQDFTIAFNGKTLIELLQNMDSNAVKLNMSTPNRAGMFYPIDEPEHKYLLMPIIFRLD
jgi:hypothetical protein